MSLGKSLPVSWLQMCLQPQPCHRQQAHHYHLHPCDSTSDMGSTLLLMAKAGQGPQITAGRSPRCVACIQSLESSYLSSSAFSLRHFSESIARLIPKHQDGGWDPAQPSVLSFSSISSYQCESYLVDASCLFAASFAQSRRHSSL